MYGGIQNKKAEEGWRTCPERRLELCLLIHSGIPIEYTRNLDLETKIELTEMITSGFVGPLFDAVNSYKILGSLHRVAEATIGKGAKRYQPKRFDSFRSMYPYHDNFICLSPEQIVKQKQKEHSARIIANMKMIEELENNGSTDNGPIEGGERNKENIPKSKPPNQCAPRPRQNT